MQKSLLFVILLTLTLTLSSQEPSIPTPPSSTEPSPALTPEEEKLKQHLESVAASLQFKTGIIDIGNGLATLTLPDNLTYLNPADTEKLLVDLWGNPDGSETLGMIFPANTSPLSDESWGVVLTYDEDGYVSDKEAESIKYDEILADMKKAVSEESKQREKDGYGTIELVNWAASPHYDRANHKIFWAKEFIFDGSDDHTLNYDIRILGRKGVLNLNIISSMSQLPVIEGNVPTILQATEFNTGKRYADYNPATDKLASYGLAALITGGVLSAATKGGFLKGLWIMILAFKKLIIIALVVIAGACKKLFGKKSMD